MGPARPQQRGRLPPEHGHEEPGSQHAVGAANAVPAAGYESRRIGRDAVVPVFAQSADQSRVIDGPVCVEAELLRRRFAGSHVRQSGSVGFAGAVRELQPAKPVVQSAEFARGAVGSVRKSKSAKPFGQSEPAEYDLPFESESVGGAIESFRGLEPFRHDLPFGSFAQRVEPQFERRAIDGRPHGKPSAGHSVPVEPALDEHFDRPGPFGTHNLNT